MDQSLAGDGRRGVSPIGNDTECVSVSQHMFLPPSVLSLNSSLHCRCKYLTHFMDLSYLAWCVCVACVYFP